MRRLLLLTFAAAISGLLTQAAFADETPRFTLTIKDHKFDPTEVQVPAGKKFELLVINQDKTAEEFESKDLHREKVIPGGAQAVLTLGPLRAGSYEFFGEFNPKTARGRIVAK